MKENKVLLYGKGDDLVVLEGYIDRQFDLSFDGWRGFLVDPSGQRLELHADFVREWVLGAITSSGDPVEWEVKFIRLPDDPLNPAIEVTVPNDTYLVVVDPTEG